MSQETTHIPKLRFPEFEGEWETKTLNSLFLVKHGFPFKSEFFVNQGNLIVTTPGNFDPEGGFRHQGPKEKFYSTLDFPSEYILKKNDLLTAMTEQAEGLIGSAILIPEDDKFLHNQRLGLLQLTDEADSFFVFHYLKTFRVRKDLSLTAAGTKVRHTSPEKIVKVKAQYPHKPEQQKIATFLTKVDQKIELLQRKKDQLTAYKKGMMQKLFSQEIRFKDENGKDFPEWEEKKLGDVADRITNKNKIDNQNVLTISAQQGLVNQMSYFNHSVAAKDLTGYYLLEKGDFAYNKSYSKGYPMGAIKKLNIYDEGVVSTLYICFRAKKSERNNYLEKYFDSGKQNEFLQKIAQEGARNHGLLNMAVGDFFNMPIPIPQPAEQQKIANYLTALDQKIELTDKKLNQAQTFKKGLLQQMFI